MAQMWIDAVDRDAIAQATNVFDKHLATDAETTGTPVEGDLRELVVPPLQILFVVSVPDRLVRVLSVAAS